MDDRSPDSMSSPSGPRAENLTHGETVGQRQVACRLSSRTAAAAAMVQEEVVEVIDAYTATSSRADAGATPGAKLRRHSLSAATFRAAARHNVRWCRS